MGREQIRQTHRRAHRARYRAVVEDAQAALAACHDDLSPAARAAYLRACVDFVTTELDHMNAISPPDAMAPDTDVVDAQAEPVSRPPPRLVAPRKP